MSTVHLILQGKGGVGKSFIAALLAQYHQEKSVAVRCFDADPVNSTLASFPALQTTKLDLRFNNLALLYSGTQLG
jgi:CO dehydrogenase nickel-insertion accessory protein CooC1